MSEKELFVQNRKHIFTFEHKISSNQLTIDEIDEILPGYIHINRISDLNMTYVSPGGCEMFERSNEEMTTKFMELTDIYVDMDFAIKHSIPPAILKFCQLKDYSNTFSFFEKIRTNIQKEFDLYCTDIKLLDNNEELICITNPINKLGFTVNKLKGILEENKFFDKNFLKFMSLTKREKEILTQVRVICLNGLRSLESQE